jgi:hypothetical protein
MAPSTTAPISIPPPLATNLSPTTRNQIYSAILSGPGIVNIDAKLTHELQRSGWLANLKEYITQLLRTGEATTIDEIVLKVKEKMGITDNGIDGDGFQGMIMNTDLQHATNGSGAANGVAARNGSVTSVNGSNGVGMNGHDGGADADIDLRVPPQAISEASRVIRKELEAVCEIATE